MSRRDELLQELRLAIELLEAPGLTTARFEINGTRFEFDALEALVEIHSYKNTRSEAGAPKPHRIMPSDVVVARTWTNTYGNPQLCLHMKNGDTHFIPDAYGGLNKFPKVHIQHRRRRKDIF